MAASAPAAPPVAPIQVPSAPRIKSGLPNGTGIIEVGAGPAVDPGPAAAPAPKKGSARDQMMKDLQGKARANHEPGSPLVAPPKVDAPRPGATDPNAEPSDEPPPAAEPGAEPAADPAADPATEPATDPKAPVTDPKAKKEKPNPWKMFEAEKAARAKAEKELQEAKSAIVPEQERKAITARLEKAEARAKELEDAIRFVDYEKSEEFQTKYDQPYKQAWERALSELKELTVSAEGVDPRPIQPSDMLELVNMRLPDAIATAKAVFGDAAEYVLSHRKEIRNLFDAQAKALADAKKNGAEHQTKTREAQQKWHTETSAKIKETWDKANSTVLNDPKTAEYFKPKEGDEEWNQSLAKGFELVDRAFAQNPMDARLTPEERAAVVQRHATVRNRAAGWGPLKRQAAKLQAQIAELQKELKTYKDTGPAAGGTVQPTNGGQPVRARDRMMADLGKLAKPL